TQKSKTVALSSSTPEISTPVKEPGGASRENKMLSADQSSSSASIPTDTIKFDWNKLLTHVQTNYVATFSVLSKCTPEVNGSKLTLYTVNKFYKKKLDDARYRTTVIDSLNTLGMNGLMIETVGTPPPPKDSLAASVA